MRRPILEISGAENLDMRSALHARQSPQGPHPVNTISPVTPPRLVTAVVGAGPAGLFFAITGRLLHERLGRDVSDWEIILLDRRSEYGRTHRLRMDPARYRSLQQDIADDRFDSLIEFLAQEGFKPVINELERKLSRLAADLGLTTHQLAVGDGPGGTWPWRWFVPGYAPGPSWSGHQVDGDGVQDMVFCSSSPLPIYANHNEP